MSDDTTESAEAEPTPRRPQPVVIRIDAKSIWQVIGAVVLTLATIWVLRRGGTVVSMVVFSIFLSLALQPAVNAIRRRFGIKRGAAVGLIYAAGVAFLLVMIVVLIPTVATLATAISENGPGWLDDLDAWLSGTFGIEVLGQQRSGDITAEISRALESWGDKVPGALTGAATAGVSMVFWLATVAMFTFYFTKDAPKIRNALLSLFNPRTQARLGWTYDRAIQESGGYFYSRLILMFICGTGFFITMALVGVPIGISIALALIGSFFVEFIPVIGTYIGSALPVVITLALRGLVPAIIVLVYAVVYQLIENYFLNPRISANTMSLSGGLAFGAALFGGVVAGPLGAIMAMPLAALISAFIEEYAKTKEVVYESQYYPPESS
ncbi:MAG: AI-2E family transporter [Nocardioidaceae bacterium]